MKVHRHTMGVVLGALLLPLLAACGGAGNGTPPTAPQSVFKPTVATPQGRVPGRVIVMFKEKIPQDFGNSRTIQSGSRIERSELVTQNDDVNFVTLSVPTGTESARIAALKRNPAVADAYQEGYVHALVAPNDPGYPQQYALTITKWDQAYNVNPTLGGLSTTTIAIVDTGIQLNHPDLAAKIAAGGTSFVTGVTSPNDDNGHGTHCAGIAAAITNNGVGIAGTNPSAKLLPVKVLNSAGSGTFSAVANGITYAADHGAKIISLSLGCTAPCFDQATSNALAYAISKGSLAVVAAGNDGAAVGFPGSDPNAMAIAATDNTDTTAFFSNFGPEVSVAAPGVDIYSTYPTSSYATLSGTSMSTPMVAGLAGLLVNATSTPASIRARIQNTADKVGPDPYVNGRNDGYGYGRINVYAATFGP